MGNENSQQGSNDENKDRRDSHRQKSPPGQQNHDRALDKKSHQTYHEFFIQHHKLYNIANVNDLSLLDPRRIIFLSIRDLYKSWTRCPSISLYNAIIIVPLKKDWVLSPHKYDGEYSELLTDVDFLTFLRWKEHQNLAIFLLDADPHDMDNEHKCNEDESSISPVWLRTSSLLQSLHDPMRSDKYNGLMFSENYWRNKSSLCGPHNAQMVNDVLQELYTVTMKFNPIKHILCESNHTLNVIVNYTAEQVTKKEKAIKVDTEDTDDSILNEDWWIADDYHEAEIDVEAIQQFEQYVNNDNTDVDVQCTNNDLILS